MLGHRALTLQDYTTILKRRWWIIAIPAIIFPIVGFGITYLVQPQYVSQTLVLVEQQKVPGVVCEGRCNGRPERAVGHHEGADFEPVAAAADHRAVQPVCKWKDVNGRSHRYDPKKYRDRADPV